METLYTAAGEALSGTPWTVYPRPQLCRDEWLNLNGLWDFAACGQEGAIRVPFCPESALAGAFPVPCGEKMVYTRRFTLPETWAGGRVLLHFGAVMRSARVTLNGTLLGRHEEGYLPFSFLLPADLPRENELRVEVVNDLDIRHPWGKQRVERGGMWYTPCSGIWQTVWAEPVPEHYVQALQVETDARGATVTFTGAETGTVTFLEKEIPFTGGRVRLEPENPRLWSPEDPWLYPFTVTAGEDSFSSYFALRTLTVEKVRGVPRLCLNGKPYFFHGLLDQGYWSDGLYTPAEPALFAADIRAAKSLGFNTLRKHIKLEPELFYYACDRLGMVVFQDMVNNGRYDYLKDTVLPTLHFQKRGDKRTHPDPLQRQIFLDTMEETVTALRNHPCICLWTIFNEGWGQFEADEAYRRLKALDGSRFIDATSGWFHQKATDVDSLHIYFDPLHLGKKPLPQLLSEYGGWSWKLPAHSANREKTYGYRKFTDGKTFRDALLAFLTKELLPLARAGLSGAIYTQLSDVEDETNGLLTWDRRVLKLAPGALQPLADALKNAHRQ